MPTHDPYGTRIPAGPREAGPGTDPVLDLLASGTSLDVSTDVSTDDAPESKDEGEYGASTPLSQVLASAPVDGRPRSRTHAPPPVWKNIVTHHAESPRNPRGLLGMAGHGDERTASLAAMQEKQKRGTSTPDDVVRYALDREKYRVTVQARLARGGMLFDTAKIKGSYRSRGTKLGMAQLPDASKEQLDEWNRDGMIWVCVPEELSKLRGAAFYSHVGKKDRFHHSSLSLGRDVICAGEWIVRQGRLVSVSANSGHYAPTLDRLYQAVLHLASALDARTTVFLYDAVEKRWVDRPARDFIQAPSAGGRYMAHPRAAF